MRRPAIAAWPGAVLALLSLGWATRFRLRGAYWSWRMETAFGRGRPTRRAMIAATLDYGDWARRMRRLSRAAG